MVIRNIKTAQILLLRLHKQTEEVRCLSTAEESTGEYPMSIGKKGDIALEEVPSLCDEQAIIAFFSPFMNSTSSAMLSGTLRKAPCVLVENLPMHIGEMFVRKLRSLGAHMLSAQLTAIPGVVI